MRKLLLSMVCALALAAAEDLKKITFESEPSMVMANGKLELTIFEKGATFANLVLGNDAEKLSPLWNPARMARETGKPSQFGSSFGHFICVDGFGPASKEETAAGLTGHGEAHIQKFEVKSSNKEGKTSTLVLAAKLPILEELFTRTIRMVDGENVIYVTSELENLLGFDRPVNWAEHATIGSPFLEPGVTVVDMSGKRAMVRPYEPSERGLPHRMASGKEFTWPDAPLVSGGTADVRRAPSPPNSGGHTTTLMDPSRKYVYVTALHPGKKLILGYVFRPDEYAWTQSWENYPPTGKLARGLEFSSQPFDVSRREAVTTGTMFGVPTYRWLPAKSKIGSHFLMFYAHAPEGMVQVDDVQLENGKLTVEDHKSGKKLVLDASLPL
ncbi:MAG: hypothetical protein ABJF23_02845 [Bryobacteraceae bacterium]